jgi:hypothetical protein
MGMLSISDLDESDLVDSPGSHLGIRGDDAGEARCM